MAKKVWVVVRTRLTNDRNSCIICGIYEDFGEAVSRVNEVFNDDCDTFDEVYGETGVGYNADNHNNGYAELHYGDCDYDDIVIRAEEYEINKPTYDSL